MLVGAGSLALAIGASADRGDHRDRGARSSERAVFRSSLAPSITTDPTIHGVGPGSANWTLEEGSVRLGENGSLKLKVEGLVITATGTPGPVTGIEAALFCGADSDTTPAATTGVVPLSTEGDASIHTIVALPSTCVAPIVLVNFVKGSTLITTRYIALTGFPN
jgi:hypothetical protein